MDKIHLLVKCLEVTRENEDHEETVAFIHVRDGGDLNYAGSSRSRVKM